MSNASSVIPSDNSWNKCPVVAFISAAWMQQSAAEGTPSVSHTLIQGVKGVVHDWYQLGQHLPLTNLLGGVHRAGQSPPVWPVCWLISVCAGTIPPIKSPLEKNDDVKKLFSIGCPVILVTLGVALLFIIRKKRKEKRLKRLRGEGGSKRRGMYGNVLAKRTK